MHGKIACVLPILFMSSLITHHCHFGVHADENQPSSALMIMDIKSEDDVDDGQVSVDEENDQGIEVFKPTDQWKEIQPGQSIPAGLHVRINLSTGKKEAKLMEKDSADDSQSTDNSRTSFVGSQDKDSFRKSFTAQELKAALKEIKADDIADITLAKKNQKLRSIDELKQELSALKLDIKSETEILKDLLDRYRACRVEKDKISVLQDVEYIVHQFDTAQDLVRLGGLELILPGLNSSEIEVRSWVAAMLGAAMQGNPRVQVAVLEHNGLSLLLRVVVLDPSAKVRAKGMFALSCLLRHFPLAQQRFLSNGGLQLLSDILQEEHKSFPDTQKLVLKISTLLYDLVIEQEFTEKHSSIEKGIMKLSIRELLVQQGFCDLFADLLLVPDKNIRKYVLMTMVKLSSDCEYASHGPKFQKLVKDYKRMLTEDGFDEDVRVLLDNLYILIHKPHVKGEL